MILFSNSKLNSYYVFLTSSFTYILGNALFCSWRTRIVMDLFLEVNSLANTHSNFCLNTCKAKCCKKGKLPLTNSEKELFDKSRFDDRGLYDLTGGCQFLDLKTNRCTIYDKRPGICREFPFILKNRTIYANSFCIGVDKDIFYDDKKIKNEHMFIKI